MAGLLVPFCFHPDAKMPPSGLRRLDGISEPNGPKTTTRFRHNEAVAQHHGRRKMRQRKFFRHSCFNEAVAQHHGRRIAAVDARKKSGLEDEPVSCLRPRR
jgi:hypothetical protein